MLWPSASEMSDTGCRFGRNRRLVLLLAWETFRPTRTPLPETAHRRDMGLNLRREFGGAGGLPARAKARVLRPRPPPVKDRFQDRARGRARGDNPLINLRFK